MSKQKQVHTAQKMPSNEALQLSGIRELTGEELFKVNGGRQVEGAICSYGPDPESRRSSSGSSGGKSSGSSSGNSYRRPSTSGSSSGSSGSASRGSGFKPSNAGVSGKPEKTSSTQNGGASNAKVTLPRHGGLSGSTGSSQNSAFSEGGKSGKVDSYTASIASGSANRPYSGNSKQSSSAGSSRSYRRHENSGSSAGSSSGGNKSSENSYYTRPAWKTGKNTVEADFNPNAEFEGDSYIVRSGDTLSTIVSKKYSGASEAEIRRLVREVAENSGITNVNRIEVGQTIFFKKPADASASQTKNAETEAPAEPELKKRWRATEIDWLNGTREEVADSIKERICPLKGNVRITGAFGSCPGDMGRDENIPDTHAAVDMVSDTGEAVAAKDGVIKYAGVHPDGTGAATGTLILIQYADETFALYGHMDPNDICVKEGASVTQGKVLGKYYNGIMGKSSGAHLHYAEFDGITEPKTKEELIRLFNGTGYFYDQTTVPPDKKVINSFKQPLQVIEPVW